MTILNALDVWIGKGICGSFSMVYLEIYIEWVIPLVKLIFTVFTVRLTNDNICKTLGIPLL